MFSASGLKNETLKVKYIYDCKLQLMGDSCRRTTVSLIFFVIDFLCSVCVFQGSTYLLIFFGPTHLFVLFPGSFDFFLHFFFVFVVIYFDIMTDRLSTSTCEKF